MWVISIIFMVAASLLLTHLLMLRREMVRMTKQLEASNKGKTGKRIEVALFDPMLEALAAQINRQSRKIDESEAKQRRIQQEFRQAVVNISHDIRTPLTSIIGYIQLLESDTITLEEKSEYVHVVKNRSQRLQSLLNDFFELALVESPDDHLKYEEINLTALISEILLDFYDMFNERNITPIFRLTEEKTAIYGDESAIRRVVENLLVNTIKYGSGQVEIQFSRQKEVAELIIMNEAKELVGSDVNLLFNRFYTADQARSTQTSGLGLSIAKALMNKMDGTLIAELKEEQLRMICRWKIEPGTESG